MSVKFGVVTVLVVLATGCGKGSSTPSETATLERNWWLSSQGECEIYCGGSVAPPECSAADCQIVTFVRFEEGAALSGALSVTETARQFSRLGPLATRPYAVEGDVIAYSDPPLEITYELEERRLIMEHQPFELPFPALDNALNAAHASEQWREVAF